MFITAVPINYYRVDSREGLRERERALLARGTIHNGGSRTAPAHGLRITTLRSFDRVTAYMAKTFPGL